MLFKISHPDFSPYDWYVPSFDPLIEEQINRMGPSTIITSAYDWPKETYEYHGWTDTLNSLWWPRGADQFSTLVLLLDDTRADLVEACVAAQVAATASNVAPRPYLILSAILSAKEGTRAAESYAPSGLDAATVQAANGVILMEWKLYPLAPVRIPETDATDTKTGLWLLPLVDIRYFHRNIALNSLTGGTTTTALAGDFDFPLNRIDHADSDPAWMPPLLGYPDDTTEPASYVEIPDNGTHPNVDPTTPYGVAADQQAAMNNWRIVCRDVRSNYNAAVGETQHTEFTGLLSDYPDDPASADSSYHRDAIALAEYEGNLITGGLSDSPIVQDLMARKITFLFRVDKDDFYYEIVLAANTANDDPPDSIADFDEDTDGLGTVERTHIPKVLLGVLAGTRTPTSIHRILLLGAAKQWMLLYYRWRGKQAFYKFPGIAPVIPNGHAHFIRWDMSATKWETTYVAIEGVEGTRDGVCVKREWRWGRIDGEGSIDDSLDGKYAWTEMEDVTNGGQFSEKLYGVVGYVKNVNGALENANYAQDDTGKRAVPVGITVKMFPGTPYLDLETGEIFDHYRFTTPDLLQVIKLRLTGERNSYGHYGAVVRRWNPDIKDFVDSEVIWAVLLTG